MIEGSTLRRRAAGALLAAAMTGGAAIAGILAGAPPGAGLLISSVPGWLLFLGSFGLPVSAVVGWWLGPRAALASTRGIPRLGVVAALGGVVLGAVEVSTVSAIRDVLAGTQPLSSLPFVVLMLPAIGLLVLGVPAFVLVLPVTLGWAALMRGLRGRWW